MSGIGRDRDRDNDRGRESDRSRDNDRGRESDRSRESDRGRDEREAEAFVFNSSCGFEMQATGELLDIFNNNVIFIESE